MAQFWLSYAQGNLRHLEDVMHNKHVHHDLLHNITSSYINYDNLPDEFIPDDFESDDFQTEKIDLEPSGKTQELESIVTNPYFSPLLAKDLTRMPKAFIMTVAHDVLRDEGALYAHRLKEAGNDVTHQHVSSGLHGLVSFHWFKDAKVAFQDVANYIKENL